MQQDARDVVFAFYGASYAFVASRGNIFSEDRLVQHLLGEPPGVGRLLVANPWRSIAGRARAQLARRAEAPFPTTEHRHLIEPLRLRRTDPDDPERATARYEARLRRAAARQGLQRPAIITGNPFVAGYGTFDWAGPVTYYAWDDWTASEPHRRWWPAYERAFAQIRTAGRRVCAVSEAARARVGPTGPSAVVPNGLAPEEWESAGQPPQRFARRQAPRLLYVGSLDARIDAAQVEAVARAWPQGSITFVGPVLDEGHVARLRALPNVAVDPPVGRAEVVALITGADACLVPHVRNRMTEAMSPLKLYEYLAGGRPVAAVDLPEIAVLGHERVVLAPCGGDFVPAVARALELGPAPEPERRGFAAANAWSARFDRLLDVALAD